MKIQARIHIYFVIFRQIAKTLAKIIALFILKNLSLIAKFKLGCLYLIFFSFLYFVSKKKKDIVPSSSSSPFSIFCSICLNLFKTLLALQSLLAWSISDKPFFFIPPSSSSSPGSSNFRNRKIEKIL